jgi:hypothetical protein
MSILTIEQKRAEEHQNGLSRRHRVAGSFLVWKKKRLRWRVRFCLGADFLLEQRFGSGVYWACFS